MYYIICWRQAENAAKLAALNRVFTSDSTAFAVWIESWLSSSFRSYESLQQKMSANVLLGPNKVLG